MKGAILGYDRETAAGILRAEDGNRYSFDQNQWRSRSAPAAGVEVDFEPSGEVAKDIFVVAPSGAGGPSAAGGANFAMPAMLEGFIFRWPLAFAAVTFIGCLLPLFSTSSLASAVAGSMAYSPYAGMAANWMSTSLFGLFDIYQTVTAVLRAQGQDALLTWSWLFYLVYLIPLTAAWVIYSEVRNNKNGGANILQRLLAGIICFVLPMAIVVGLPIYFNMSGSEELGHAMQAIPWGLAAFMIVGGGLGLLLSGVGVIRSPVSAGGAIITEAPASRGIPRAAIIALVAAVLVIAGGVGGFMWWQNMQLDEWNKVSRTDAAALRTYVNGHVNGKYHDAAATALSELEQNRYLLAQQTGTIAALQGFLNDFPQSSHAPELHDRLLQLQAIAQFQQAAPAPISPIMGAVISGREATIEWASMNGAVSYNIEVDLADSGAQQWDADRTFRAQAWGTSYPLTFNWSAPARWRVQGVDSNGNQSAFSAWQTFTVQ
jgi:hypothetical protein